MGIHNKTGKYSYILAKVTNNRSNRRKITKIALLSICISCFGSTDNDNFLSILRLLNRSKATFQ